jgi:alkaline phosphatase D
MTQGSRGRIGRRRFLAGAAVASGSLVATGGLARTVVAQDRARPPLPYGVQSGDITAHQAVVSGATDRPALMVVEYSTAEQFTDARPPDR